MYQSTEPCPHCGAQNLRGTWVCADCGNTLLMYCPNCRAGNATGSQYCHACGSPLSPTTQAPDYPAGQQTYAQYPPPDYQSPGQQPYTTAGYGAPGNQNAYPGYQQYPQYGGYPPQRQAFPGANMLDGFIGRVKQILVNTNPILLSALVVLIVGMGIFLLLAFQLQWIKVGQPTKPATTTTARAPSILTLQVDSGTTTHSALITWTTDQNSSSQVAYGLWPVINNIMPIEDDPRTGTSDGVLKHEATLDNLQPNQKYSFKVISINKDDKSVEKESFFTTAPD